MEVQRSRRTRAGERGIAASLRLGPRMLAIISLALLPALGLLLYASLEFRGSAIGDTKAEALRLASVAAENQARNIEGSRELLAVLASMPEIRRGDEAACRRILSGLIRGTSTYLNFGVTDSAGNIVCSSLPLQSPINAADRSWFHRAWSAKRFSVGDYQIGRITGKPSLNVAQPIYDLNGRPRGVLFAAIDLATFAKLAARVELPPGTTLRVVDGAGVVLARYPKPGPWIGRDTSREPSTIAMLATRRGVFEAPDLEGVPRLYGCSPLPTGGGIVAVGLPEAAALQAANRVLVWGLVSLGLAALAGVLLAWLLGRGLVLHPVASSLESAEGAVRRLKADADRETRLFRAVVDQTADPVVVADGTGRLLHWNAALREAAGYEREELASLHVWDLAPDVDRGHWTEVWRRARAAGSVHFLGSGGRRDGGRYPAEIRMTHVAFEGQEYLCTVLRDVTGIRAAQSALTENALLSAAIEQAPVAVVLTDAEGRIEHVNAAFMRITGYSLEEVRGSTPRVLKSGEQDDEFYRRLWTTVLSGASWRGEMVNRRKDGSLYTQELVVAPVRDVEGRLAHFVGIGQDVTEGRHLRDSLELTQVVVDRSTDMVLWVDSTGRFVYANESALRNLGYTRYEFLSRSVWDVSRAYRAEDWPEAWESVRRAGSLKQEDEVVRKDGTSFPVEMALTHVGAGVREIHCAILRDLTERRRAEEALRDSERQYRTLVDSARDCIFSVSRNGTIESLNPAFEATMGWTREEWIGHPFAPLIHPDDLARASEMLRRASAGEPGPAMECRALTKSGDYVHWEVSVSPARPGEPSGLLGIARDISERRQLENQLRQSQKMEAVGSLAGGVAHDFNNLLTAIMGYTQLLAVRTPPGSPALHDVEEILKAATRASLLTRQLLTFSRREMVQPSVLDLNALMTDLAKMLRRLIGEEIEMVIAPAAARPAVNADPGHLEQVILNLAVNARDAMPRGGRLTIETSNADIDADYAGETPGLRPGPYVLLAVSDTGTGMDETTKARIFEPFFTTKEAGKGTGLGLSTVYGIVQQCEGTIRVYSDVGFGTTFKIYLPCAEGPVEASRPADSLEDAPRGSETVLIVEDQDAVAAVMRGALESCGYRILESRHALDAIRMFEERREPIHLLVSDVVLPMIAGPELVQRLRNLRPDLRVLYVSGYTERALAPHVGPGASSSSFLPKPFTPGTLVRKVREVLDAAPAGAAQPGRGPAEGHQGQDLPLQR